MDPSFLQGTAYIFAETFQKSDVVSLEPGQVVVSFSTDPDHYAPRETEQPSPRNRPDIMSEDDFLQAACEQT